MPFCPHLGVSLRRGSLAKERNTFTFLSNLVRTALACSTLSLPHLKSLRHTRKKTQRRGEKQLGSLGLEYFMAQSLGLVLSSATQGLRPTEGAPASLLLEGGSQSILQRTQPRSCPVYGRWGVSQGQPHTSWPQTGHSRLPNLGNVEKTRRQKCQK